MCLCMYVSVSVLVGIFRYRSTYSYYTNGSRYITIYTHTITYSIIFGIWSAMLSRYHVTESLGQKSQQIEEHNVLLKQGAFLSLSAQVHPVSYWTVLFLYVFVSFSSSQCSASCGQDSGFEPIGLSVIKGTRERSCSTANGTSFFQANSGWEKTLTLQNTVCHCERSATDFKKTRWTPPTH